MKVKLIYSVTALVAFGELITGTAVARDQIQIVGSSTVFPFTSAVAEQFGQKNEFKTPVVEATGSGGGMKLFCSGVGVDTPDIANASRRIKESEFDTCVANGVTPVEVKIGFDGIVLANVKGGDDFSLTLEQIFLALAKEIPVDGTLIANPNRSWSDISPSLPNQAIEVLGPPPTSGTRDAFVEIAMEGGCKALEGASELGLEMKKCHQIREDGAYVDAGENDNLIVQKLEANPNAVGIFGFSFLDQNSDKLKGATVNGQSPEFEAIAAGEYAISRSLYFYVKKEHVGVVPGMKEFIAEFTSDGAWGDEGYLSDKGMIPLPVSQRNEIGFSAKSLTPLSM